MVMYATSKASLAKPDLQLGVSTYPIHYICLHPSPPLTQGFSLPTLPLCLVTDPFLPSTDNAQEAGFVDFFKRMQPVSGCSLAQENGILHRP